MARATSKNVSLFVTAILVIALSLAAGCGTEDDGVDLFSSALSAASAADRAALALRWAPVHNQDVDQTGSHALGGASDYITRVDYDGDLTATNNWDNAGRFSLPAYAYSSVVETSSHWFIIYMFF